MTHLVDLVNVNADASCLAAAEWLDALAHGEQSRMCRWLQGYVTGHKRVTLGFIGGAVADMVKLNPEAIALVNAHPEVFEVVVRPFAHDVSLLRTGAGFRLNLELGREIIGREFKQVVPYYLPPEFMLTNEQVKLLADAGIAGVFVNPARFSDEIQRRLPAAPYEVAGILGTRLNCIPVQGQLTARYLDALHRFSATGWNDALLALDRGPTCFSWRDGESVFLLPDGLERERVWLEEESPAIVRASLSPTLAQLRFVPSSALDPSQLRSYPVHSFLAWCREFRMLGFIERLRSLELRLGEMPRRLALVWLQAANSDVLSSVEKDSPIVELVERVGGVRREVRHTIWRSERGVEGEEFLAIAEGLLTGATRTLPPPRPGAPHLEKLRARVEYFCGPEERLP
jgi:hypothetical protein